MNFRKILYSEKFIITAELAPNKGGRPEGFLKNVALIKDLVDAINITDNQRAIMRASALVYSHLAEQQGARAIWQITGRDRNSLALESDLLGAAALGLKNILVVTGDFPDHRADYCPKPVYELDSVNLIRLIKKISAGRDLQEKEIKNPPDFLVGAVVNPRAEPAQLQILKLWKKVAAGAEFIQTQPVFSADEWTRFMDEVRRQKKIFEKNYPGNITLKMPKILAGIFPITSLKLAHFLNQKLSGVRIPAELMARLEKSTDPLETGLEETHKLVEKIRSSADGIHLMAMSSAETINRICRVVRGASDKQAVS